MEQFDLSHAMYSRGVTLLSKIGGEAMAKSPQGFIVVLPGEIIEIAQDDDISWLTLFYALPKELA